MQHRLVGDDIEPVGESRADVEMGNEEEESVESEIPLKRTRRISQAQQEPKDCGGVVCV